MEKKQKSIKEALAFKFNDDSISKMVEEKEKFRKNPINYAMRKTRLQKNLEMAQTSGDAEKTEELKTVSTKSNSVFVDALLTTVSPRLTQ